MLNTGGCRLVRLSEDSLAAAVLTLRSTAKRRTPGPQPREGATTRAVARVPEHGGQTTVVMCLQWTATGLQAGYEESVNVMNAFAPVCNLTATVSSARRCRAFDGHAPRARISTLD